MTDSLILMAFLVAIVFLSGALLAATPWFMKKNECFAVTIPESAQADVRFLAFRKRYAVAVLAVMIGVRLVGGNMDLASGLIILILAPELFSALREVGSA